MEEINSNSQTTNTDSDSTGDGKVVRNWGANLNNKWHKTNQPIQTEFINSKQWPKVIAASNKRDILVFQAAFLYI